MIEIGGPVVAGKAKDNIGKPTIKVSSISREIMHARMKYQDIPVLCIASIYTLLRFFHNVSLSELIALLVYIGLTCTQILCEYTSLKWTRISKEVDLPHIIKAIKAREEQVAESAKERMEALELQKSGKYVPKSM